MVNNKAALSTKAVSIFVDTGLKPKLVLSAQTDEQVLELTRAFATYHLPGVRRASVSIHELYANTKLSPRPIVSANNYRLDDIEAPVLVPSWRPDPAHINFNVADPGATSGLLTLKIIASESINPNSRLKVRLNDKSIGYTQLDKTSKNVSFNIRQGLFKATGNRISIEPVLEPAVSSTCATSANTPALLVSGRSKLELNNPRPSALTDLSRLSATGAPFSNTETAIVLTARTNNDRASALHFLGFAAQTFGPAWTQAEYLNAMPTGNDLNKHLLVIGPNAAANPALVAAAPSALKLALQGKTINIPASQKTARLGRHASLDGDAAFKMAARNIAAPSRLKSGGVASLFPSPYANGKFVGIISSDKSSGYSRAMNAIAAPSFWNALQGSVVRWDRNNIIMAQTAVPLPAGFSLPKAKASPRGRLAALTSSAGDWLASLTKRTSTQPAPIAPKVQKQAIIKPTVKLQKQKASIAPKPISLRGTIPTPPVKKIRQQRSAPMSISMPQMPKMPALDSVGHTIKKQYIKTKLAFRAQVEKGGQVRAVKAWFNDIKGNQTALLILLTLAGIFMLALATPKSSRAG